MNQTIRNIIFTFHFCMIFIYCSPDPVDLMKDYPEVYNTHDVKKIMSLYAEHAVFEVEGLFSLQGLHQLQDITRYDSVLNVQMAIGDLRRQDDTVFCHLIETNDWLKVSEIDTAFYLTTFVFEGGLIKSISAKTEPITAESFRQVLVPFINWAREEKPEVLKEMMPEGVFIYNAVNATKNLELLKTWKTSQEKQ